MSAISNRENFLKVLRGETGDRVPWLPLVGVHAAKVLGVELKDFLYSSDLIVRGVVESARLYKADAIPLCFDLQIEAELLGATTKVLPKMPPAIIKHPLAKGEISDLPRYNANSGRLKIVLDAIGDIKAQLGESTALIGLVTGVLTLAYQLRGRAFLDDIATNSSSLVPLLEYCKDIQKQTISAYAERGIDAIAIVEPLCSNLDADFFSEKIASLSNELFDKIRAANLPSCFFLCGDINSCLEQIAKCRCDNISACAKVDLSVLKQRALAANKSFGGNLNPTDSILRVSVEKSVADAKACLEIGGKRGYILSSGCDLAFDTPFENLQAISKISK